MFVRAVSPHATAAIVGSWLRRVANIQLRRWRARARKKPELFRQNELVTVSHAQAVIPAAVLDQDFPRLAEQLFGAQ